MKLKHIAIKRFLKTGIYFPAIIIWCFINPGVSYSQVPLSESLLKSYELERLGNYPQAIKYIENIEFPADFIYLKLARLGWLNYLNKNYFAATGYYRKADDVEKNLLEPKEMLMECYFLMQEYAKAEKFARKILRISPANYAAHYQLARLAMMNMNYPEAEFHLKQIIKLFPTDYSSNKLLKQCYTDRQKKSMAAKMDEKLKILYPEIKTGVQ